MPRRAVFLGDGENWNTLHQTFTPHAGLLHLIWEAGPIIKCEPLRRELLQKSWDYPFIVMNQKSAPILFVDNPHLGWLKKYKMKPGKRYPVKLPFPFAKHNAIISACNEIDQRGLPSLICSHCWHSGDGLPVRIRCVECFISKQWFNALWSTTSWASHTSSGVLLENTWGEEGWGVLPRDQVSFALQELCWLSRSDRQACVCIQNSARSRSPVRQQCLPRGERRPRQDKHNALVWWKSHGARPICRSQRSLKQRWEVKW